MCGLQDDNDLISQMTKFLLTHRGHYTLVLNLLSHGLWVCPLY